MKEPLDLISKNANHSNSSPFLLPRTWIHYQNYMKADL